MTALSPLFGRAEFSDLPGWAEADLGLALAAFRRSAERFLAGEVATGRLGIDAEAFRPAAEVALSSADALAFFETAFRPARIAASATDAAARGFCTGYYEPEVEASLVETERFRFPLYAPPADLVKVDNVSRPVGLDPYFRFARRRPDGMLDEYPDRAAIEAGFLKGRGLEIAWLDNPVDAFFIHIQGSARLSLPDGRRIRVTYAAKTGHPFTAIGRSLVAEGELTLAEADMDGIRGWLAAYPTRVRALLDRNRSFIFFREAPVEDESLGPVAAAKVPLTPMASIAVDRELHTFGLPIFIDAASLVLDGAPFRRLMIAQDTGSAILGPARADIFVGSGFEAGRAAGRVRHPGDFYALLPAALWQRLAS
ncbi:MULTISPECIES: murein transglycosylase A [unclassified Aureimonas]|uniref:murein transglycosylase A n=1 Tax=unclassified Aureimonas TaxID=2615206 RepID=UPI0006FD2404|nr:MULTISPECIES: MltA domain-containing protein [unclassified Aureimonas]KQT52574.1 transglycosylase [Aureimonas sp. Leaf427]KQT77525.1 transglycosylase [Aureimonas sp. Leaf460]